MALEHLVRADALKSQGANRGAESRVSRGIELNPYLAEALDGLARLRWPGPDYLAWLSHFHASRRPPVYLEIGVATGRTLALARPPTRAIGIDPAPVVEAEFTAETHFYRETSDRFFSENRLARLLDGDPVALALIDGLHTFEQALKDFINLEAHTARDSAHPAARHHSAGRADPEPRRDDVVPYRRCLEGRAVPEALPAGFARRARSPPRRPG